MQCVFSVTIILQIVLKIRSDDIVTKGRMSSDGLLILAVHSVEYLPINPKRAFTSDIQVLKDRSGLISQCGSETF